jgi:ferrous-iron efflux pump FieF
VSAGHHHGHHHHHAHHASLTTKAAIASVTMALFLLSLKGFAALETGSVAMVASLVTLFGVRVAAMPADVDHRFGHGKAESLAALVQVGIIIVSALGIGWRAIERLVEGERTQEAEYGIAVSLVAIAATFALLAYQRHVIRRTGSVAIQADHVHYQTDLLLNLSVIAALVLDQYLGLTGADPLLGIAIALWLLFGAVRASGQAIDQLMDREWPEEKRSRFARIAGDHPASRGIHDLRTRTSGSHQFAQFHMWLDPAMTLAAAHDVVEEIEARLAQEFPGVEVLIHLDPEGKIDQPGNSLAETNLTPSAGANE